MIGTVWKIGWLSLRRDRPALALTFLTPLLFFSIFAAVFAGVDRGSVSAVRTLILEPEVPSPGLTRLLAADPTLELVSFSPPPATRAEALDLVRRGRVDAVVLPPDGLERDLGRAAGARPRLEVLADSSNPVATRVLEGALQGAAFKLLAELYGAGAEAAGVGPLALEIEDVLGGDDKRPSVAFFAAGIGVMFLLFAVSGRGALLIEERESGVLTRILTSGVGLSRLLAGRWLYLASLGFVQVTVMFVWGALVFGLDLWTGPHLAGFALMTAATAAAAAALGLLLSVICRTRAQLNGVAVVLVLVMSALGGSLFPRFLMPESLRLLGLATFNAWALDGYRKVFWYETPLADLTPQLAVLAALTAAFLTLSRLLAARWGAERGG